MPRREIVQELMIQEILTVREDTTILDATRRMTESNRGAVVVVNSAGDGVGIFTERDLLKRVVAKQVDPRTTPVSRVMTKEMVCVGAEDPLQGLPEVMLKGNFRHLPVVEGQSVIGMLSIRDIVRYLTDSE